MDPLGPILLGTQGYHGTNFAGDPGVPWDQNWPMTQTSPIWPRPIDGVQDHQDPGLPKAVGEALGDEFSPKGVLNPHLRGVKGGINEVWPHFLEVKFFDLEWTDSDVLNILLAYSSLMSSKLTELTEYSLSAPPPSVLCGSGAFSRLSSPSIASSGHFDPSQSYDGYKEFEVLDPAFTECLAKGKDCFQHFNPRSTKLNYCFIGKKPCHCTGLQASNVRRYLWSREDGPIGKEFPVSEAPTPDGTSGFSQLTGSRQRDVAWWTNVGGPIQVGGRPIYSSSEVPISRINTDGVVKRIKRIADSPTDPDAEGSDEFDGEEPLANRFQKQVILNTPRTFQPVLASIPTKIPPPSPSTSHARPGLNPEVRPSPNQKSRNPPITTSCQLQPVASSSRRRDGLSPLLFPAAQVFQRKDCWPIQITREDPNGAS
ncbi:hypothetical protein O181_035046 [Austropuccinia psidii MF-1]|uniref:Uncharacterized protein n=1 Tax=Austropuccinia psidii MF-1 TaxID=1389203 RepID=A0A9Q3D1X5_9BASI|nr:hypothetical protein [Austropuccinia psidii MF-1]